MIQNNRILAVTAAVVFLVGASVLVSAQDAGPRPAGLDIAGRASSHPCGTSRRRCGPPSSRST